MTDQVKRLLITPIRKPQRKDRILNYWNMNDHNDWSID